MANMTNLVSRSNCKRPIAILGGTSAIARDFILQGAAQGDTFAIFARRPAAVATFLRTNALPEGWVAGPPDSILQSPADIYAAVLNFVGVGDPAKAKAMGALILSATVDIDRIAIRYLERSPATPYIFLSSGAVYGAAFEQPVSDSTKAIFPINAISPQDYYGIAKIFAETAHRAMTDMTIIDIRIFSYISRHMDLNSGFIIADIVRDIQRRAVFQTNRHAMWRDYIHPNDLYSLISACINAPAGTNQPVDAFSSAPIEKQQLLRIIAREFGLEFSLTELDHGVSATGSKPFYYSMNRAAAALGYQPTRTSAEAIIEEVGALIAGFSKLER